MANKQNVVQLIFEGNNLTAVKAADGTVSAMKRVDAQSNKTGGLLNSVFGSLQTKIALAGVAAATGLIALIKNSIDTAESLEKMSQRVGLSVESLSTLRYVAGLGGTDIDVFEKAVERMSRNLYDADKGLLTSKEAFDDLRIGIHNATGQLKSGEQIIYEVADRFKKMEDGSLKTALALKIFGRAGADLIPMLNRGSEQIKKYQEEARKLGLEVSTQTAKGAAELKDNMLRLESAVKGVGLSIAQELLPSLVGVTGAMTIVAQDGQTMMTVGQGLALIIKVLATAFGGLATGALVAAEGLGTYYAVMGKLITFNWDEIPTAISKGWQMIKETSLSAGNAFNALWGDTKKYQDLLKALAEQDALGLQKAETQKLRDEWNKTAKTLKHDIILAGLDPQSAKLQELIWKAQDLKEKYKGISGAAAGIDQQLKLWIQQAFELDNVTIKQAENILKIKPPKDLVGKDIWGFIFEGIKPASEIVKSTINDISTESLIHFTLLQDGVSDIFGNMAGAAESAYQAMGEKNRTFFDIYKAFAVAQAGIDTYQSAVAAYKAMVGIPLVGPGLAIAAAAAATAFGLANIARIASMQPGTRAGGNVQANSTPSYIPPASRNYNTTTTTTTSKTIAPQVTIHINAENIIGENLDKFVREKLSVSIKKAVNDGVFDFG